MTNPARLLVVDDEANLALSLATQLRRAGYAVETAASGAEALERIARAPPDLVLLDVTMPGRDGFDVCHTIRDNPAWSGVRVIFLTARARDIDRRKGLALGADDYVTKPFATADLIARIANTLGRR